MSESLFCIVDGSVTLSFQGLSCVSRLFHELDQDHSSGLNFSEFAHYVKLAEEGFHLTQDMFSDLEIQRCDSNDAEISLAGFQSVFLALLNADPVKAQKRLINDLRLFNISLLPQDDQQPAAVVLLEDEDSPPPVKIKKDALALLKAGAANKPAAVKKAKPASKKQLVSLPPPSKNSLLSTSTVESTTTTPFVDLTNSQSSFSSVPAEDVNEKPAHPFFNTTLKRKALLQLEQSEKGQQDKLGRPFFLPDFPPVSNPMCEFSLPPFPPSLPVLFVPLMVPTMPYKYLPPECWTQQQKRIKPTCESVELHHVEKLQWTEKYRPDRFSNVLMSHDSKQVLKEFLQGFLEPSVTPSNFSGDEYSDDARSRSNHATSPDFPPFLNNALLLYGPTGCGKTVSVHVGALELGYQVLEVNASDDLLHIEKLVGEASQSYGLNASKKLSLPLILIDEFDAAFESSPDFGASLSLVLKKFIVHSKCPVVLIGAEDKLPWSTDGVIMDQLRTISIRSVRCDMPSIEDVSLRLSEIIKLESISETSDDDYALRLAQYYNADIRKCINHLHAKLPLPLEPFDKNDEEKEDDGWVLHVSKMKRWFSFFYRNRFSGVEEVPFLLNMCRLEELNKSREQTEGRITRRSGKSLFLPHFCKDLSWVDCKNTVAQFGFECGPHRVELMSQKGNEAGGTVIIKKQSRRQYVLSDDEEEDELL